MRNNNTMHNYVSRHIIKALNNSIPYWNDHAMQNHNYIGYHMSKKLCEHNYGLTLICSVPVEFRPLAFYKNNHIITLDNPTFSEIHVYTSTL